MNRPLPRTAEKQVDGTLIQKFSTFYYSELIFLDDSTKRPRLQPRASNLPHGIFLDAF